MRVLVVAAVTKKGKINISRLRTKDGSSLKTHRLDVDALAPQSP